MGEVITRYQSLSGNVEKYMKQYVVSYELCISFDIFSDLVEPNSTSWFEIRRWIFDECEGKVLFVWDHPCIYFEYSTDRLAFKLKWL